MWTCSCEALHSRLHPPRRPHLPLQPSDPHTVNPTLHSHPLALQTLSLPVTPKLRSCQFSLLTDPHTTDLTIPLLLRFSLQTLLSLIPDLSVLHGFVTPDCWPVRPSAPPHLPPSLPPPAPPPVLKPTAHSPWPPTPPALSARPVAPPHAGAHTRPFVALQICRGSWGQERGTAGGVWAGGPVVGRSGTPGAGRAAPPPSALATGFVFRKHFR